MCVCVCAPTYVCMRERARAHAFAVLCVCVCVSVCVYVCGWVGVYAYVCALHFINVMERRSEKDRDTAGGDRIRLAETRVLRGPFDTRENLGRGRGRQGQQCVAPVCGGTHVRGGTASCAGEGRGYHGWPDFGWRG